MDDINFFDKKGRKIKAELIFAIKVPELNKTFVAINNETLVFSKESSYNNLDILELIAQEDNYFYVRDISKNDWELVKQAITKELLSKIK